MGGDDALAVAPHAAVAGHGSRAGQNHALHAADVPGVPLQLFGRPGALLDGQQPADRFADQADENYKPDRPTATPTASALTPLPKRKKKETK